MKKPKGYEEDCWTPQQVMDDQHLRICSLKRRVRKLREQRDETPAIDDVLACKVCAPIFEHARNLPVGQEQKKQAIIGNVCKLFHLIHPDYRGS